MCLKALQTDWTKNWYFKGKKLKNQERIGRFEGKCPIPHWQY